MKADLTENEAKLVAVLLEKAADQFSNNGCNDFRISDHVVMTDREKCELDRDWHWHNGDPEEHDPDGNHDYQSDFVLMLHFAARLRGDNV